MNCSVRERSKKAGRVRYNRQEGLALVAEWRQSGLSQSAFCRERGLGPHRLRYWSQVALEQTETAKREFFVVATDEHRAASAETEVSSIASDDGAAIIVVVPARSISVSLRAVVQELGQ
jgi:transposase-like protein